MIFHIISGLLDLNLSNYVENEIMGENKALCVRASEGSSSPSGMNKLSLPNLNKDKCIFIGCW